MIPLPFVTIIASTAFIGLAFIVGPLRAIGYLTAIAAAIAFAWLAFAAAAVL